MIKIEDKNQQYLDGFKTPFNGKLRKDNRWVVRANLIPWEAIETEYAKHFSENEGAGAINGRIAYGALFIQEETGLSDRDVVEIIAENPYMQYFLGLCEFIDEPLFDSSMMVYFRKRLPNEFIDKINRMTFEPEAKREIENPKTEKHNKDKKVKLPPVCIGMTKEEIQGRMNKGKMILDATIAPADIRYPSDLSLLNEARENQEQIIEELWEYGDRQGHKTSYSRKKARKEYLTMAKQKKPRKAKIQKTIRRQLAYIKSNMETVERLLLISGNEALPEKRLARIKTIGELYHQQLHMNSKKTNTCEDRIVSLRQPHIRPMVRGKSGKEFEFGQKVSAEVVGGYTFIDHKSYDNFNEGIRLQQSVEKYKERYGYYPEAVLADKIYRNRDNLAYCKKNGIRLSGPPLGRPKKDPTAEEKQQTARDGSERNIIEGRFGTSKRRYGLDRIMAYLPETGMTEVSMKIFCMNVCLKAKSIMKKNPSLPKRVFGEVYTAENIRLDEI